MYIYSETCSINPESLAVKQPQAIIYILVIKDTFLPKRGFTVYACAIKPLTDINMLCAHMDMQYPIAETYNRRSLFSALQLLNIQILVRVRSSVCKM